MIIDAEKDIVLHYIDKLHAFMIVNERTRGRISVLLFLASCAVIILSNGIVSTDQTLSIGALVLAIPYWLALLAGAWIVGILFIYFRITMKHGMLLVNTINRLYQSVGYRDESFIEARPTAIYNSHIMAVMHAYKLMSNANFNKILYTWGGNLVLLVWVVIPALAEALACYRMVILFGSVWWVIFSFFALFGITVGYLFAE